jgi:hypothetical protein
LSRQEFEQIQAQLAEAVTARAEVFERSGERQAAVVLGIRDLAADFVKVAADERQADELVQQLAETAAAYATRLGVPAPVVPLPVSTCISLRPVDAPGGQPLALLMAINEARAGRVQAVAARLGEAFGWLPPTASELAAAHERFRELAEAGRQAEADYRRRVPQQKAPVVHYDPRGGTAGYGVDDYGNPLREPAPNRPPMQVPEHAAPSGIGPGNWPAG